MPESGVNCQQRRGASEVWACRSPSRVIAGYCSQGPCGYAGRHGLAETGCIERGRADGWCIPMEPMGKGHRVRLRFGPEMGPRPLATLLGRLRLCRSLHAGCARSDRPGSPRRTPAGGAPVNPSTLLQSPNSRRRPIGTGFRVLAWILTAVLWIRCGAEEGASSTEAQGREWAQRLRTVAPEQASTNRAVLRIRGREGRRQVAVTVITRPGNPEWSVEYHADVGGGSGPQEVSKIRYQAQGPPRFEARVDAQGMPRTLEGATAGDRPIAGSDFLLRELGMEFLHWPEQRIRGRELSNGRWCQVLESVSGRNDGPASVRSWIDEKLGVILSAEVYDARKVRLKQFSITQFREQADRWTCSVSMVDDLRGTKTELSFDGPVPR